jgi:carboxylesterase
VGAIALFFVLGFVLPVSPVRYELASDPADSFAEGSQRIGDLQRAETGVKEECRTIFLHHGQAAARTVVLLHGFTSCPYQYHQLAEELYASGYNVVVPLLPHHGQAGPEVHPLRDLRSEEALALANQVVDAAQGLGDQVTVVGISYGGALATWMAQNRADLEQAVILSPAYGLRMVPTWLQRPAMTLLPLLPSLQVNNPNQVPAHSYRGTSSRALSEVLRLGQSVLDTARNAAPVNHGNTIITTPGDRVVRLELAQELEENWLGNGGNVRSYQFDPQLDLIHDFIEPSGPKARPDVVYSMIMNFIQSPDR